MVTSGNRVVDSKILYEIIDDLNVLEGIIKNDVLKLEEIKTSSGTEEKIDEIAQSQGSKANSGNDSNSSNNANETNEYSTQFSQILHICSENNFSMDSVVSLLQNLADSKIPPSTALNMPKELKKCRTIFTEQDNAEEYIIYLTQIEKIIRICSDNEFSLDSVASLLQNLVDLKIPLLKALDMPTELNDLRQRVIELQNNLTAALQMQTAGGSEAKGSKKNWFSPSFELSFFQKFVIYVVGSGLIYLMLTSLTGMWRIFDSTGNFIGTGLDSAADIVETGTGTVTEVIDTITLLIQGVEANVAQKQELQAFIHQLNMTFALEESRRQSQIKTDEFEQDRKLLALANQHELLKAQELFCKNNVGISQECFWRDMGVYLRQAVLYTVSIPVYGLSLPHSQINSFALPDVPELPTVYESPNALMNGYEEWRDEGVYENFEYTREREVPWYYKVIFYSTPFGQVHFMLEQSARIFDNFKKLISIDYQEESEFVGVSIVHAEGADEGDAVPEIPQGKEKQEHELAQKLQKDIIALQLGLFLVSDFRQKL